MLIFCRKESRILEDKKDYSEHRKRVRESYLNHGFDSKTHPYLVLEMLLYYSIPRIDTKPIAKSLMSKFKTLNAVFSASIEQLCEVKGIGKTTAIHLKLIGNILNICNSEKNGLIKNFVSTDDIGNFLLGEYLFLSVEKFSVICLDAIGNKLSFDFLSKGDTHSVGVSTRDIVELAIKHKATSIVLCHNHPSGIALPSPIDAEITRIIVDTLMPIGIRVFDHIIIAGNDYVSMSQSCDFCDIFKYKK